MDEIDKNILAFEQMQNELEKEHLNKWVLFHDEKLVNVFDNFEGAANEASEKFDSGTYLIRQVGVSSVTLPVSVMSR